MPKIKKYYWQYITIKDNNKGIYYTHNNKPLEFKNSKIINIKEYEILNWEVKKITTEDWKEYFINNVNSLFKINWKTIKNIWRMYKNNIYTIYEVIMQNQENIKKVYVDRKWKIFTYKWKEVNLINFTKNNVMIITIKDNWINKMIKLNKNWKEI